MPNIDELQSWHGRDLIDRDGDKIGSIGDVYLDERDRAAGVADGQDRPVRDAGELRPHSRRRRAEGDTVRVPYEKSQVKDAPNVDADGALSQDEESRLYRHYGLSDGERTPTPVGRGRHRRDRRRGPRPRHGRPRHVVGPGDRRRDDALGGGGPRRHHPPRDRPRAAAQVRRHRERDQTVPVQREEVRVEREPITDANRDAALSGGDITEEEHEVTLHAEEPVVEKRTVPKERVRMDRDTVTDEQTVSEEVRKERIETEGDVDQRFRTEDDIARDRR